MSSVAVGVLSCCFAVGSLFSWPQQGGHLLVTDEAGNPLPGVVVSLDWEQFETPPRSLRESPVPATATYTTDAKGRFTFPQNDELQKSFVVRKAELSGYVLEEYLNPSLKLPPAYLRKSTAKEPFRLVLRKKLDETDLPVELKCSHATVPLRSGEPVVAPVDVNLFADVRVPNQQFVDFTVVPQFDSEGQRWSLVLSTTNSGCGLIASSVRAFKAPETGYQSRITIPEDVFRQPSFTLYLQTRTPRVYAMVLPKIRLEQDPTSKESYHVLDLSTSLANLRGGRVFEQSEDVCALDLQKKQGAGYYLTKQHYLPPLDVFVLKANKSQHRQLQGAQRVLLDYEHDLKTEIKSLGPDFPHGDAENIKFALITRQQELTERRLGRLGVELSFLETRFEEMCRFLPPGRLSTGGLKRLDREHREENTLDLMTICARYLEDGKRIAVLESEIKLLEAGQMPPPAVSPSQPKPESGETYLPYRHPFQELFCESGSDASENPQTFDVDLFRSAFDMGPAQYADFSVTPHFDLKTRRWTIEFTTKHADCGLIATTNRVFMAPETGYQPHVVVSQEDYQSPTFTLYLRTRTPVLHVMVVPAPKWSFCSSEENMSFFGLGIESIDLNLTGGRVLAPSKAADDQNLLGPDDARIFLEEHRYPPLPDLAVRRANGGARAKLAEELDSLVYEKTFAEAELLARNRHIKTMNQVTETDEELRKKADEASRKIAEVYRKLSELGK